MDWNTFLRDRNLKVTKARVTILEILNDSNKGLSAEDIYEQIRIKKIEINLSTIYRTLEALEQKSALNKMSLGQGSFVYNLKKDEHMHKLQCDVCHSEYDIPCPMAVIEELLKKQAGFTITEHKIELTGVCNNCSLENEE